MAVGGTVFIRLILPPSFVALDAQARQRLMAGIARWLYPTLWWAIAAIAVSGVYNLVLALHIPSPEYRAGLAVKIVLAFALFGIAFGITIPHP